MTKFVLYIVDDVNSDGSELYDRMLIVDDEAETADLWTISPRLLAQEWLACCPTWDNLLLYPTTAQTYDDDAFGIYEIVNSAVYLALFTAPTVIAWRVDAGEITVYNAAFYEARIAIWEARAQAPTAPTLTYVAATSASITVTIGGSSEDEEYAIQVSPNVDYTAPLANWNNAIVGLAQRIVIDGLAAATTYYIRARAISSAEQYTDYSNTITHATSATGATPGSLAIANNLSDVANVETSRTNLGLGTAAVLASGAVALVANNLSDLADKSTATKQLANNAATTYSGTAIIITAVGPPLVTATTTFVNGILVSVV